MQQDINGWTVINRCLTKQEKKQKDLAQALRITPSAITQAKQGAISLDSEQLAQLAEVLKMDESEAQDFYSAIFNARLLSPGHPHRSVALRHMRLRPVESGGGGERLTPRLPLALLAEYEPAVETMSAYLRRHGAEVKTDTIRLELPAQNRREPDLAAFSALEIKLDLYPEPGELVLLARRSGPMLLRRWRREAESLCFPPEFAAGEEFRWHPTTAPGDLRWMRPVTLCVTDLRS